MTRPRGLESVSFVVFGVWLLSVMISGLTNPVWAGSLFNLTVSSPGYSTYSQGFSSAEDIERRLKPENIAASFGPSFSKDTSPMSIILDYRGLPINVSFVSNSSTMVLNIPSIGVSKVFAGTSRGNSVSLLMDWLKSEGGSALTRMNQYLMAHTPTDPIAGNPASMLGQLVQTQYDNAFTNPTTQIAPASTPAPTGRRVNNNNLIGIATTVGNIRAAGLDGQYYTLPLSYSYRFSDDPRHALSLHVPISIVTLAQANSYAIGLGLSYSQPLASNWVITPAVQYGFMGSPQMGSAAQMMGGSISSSATWIVGPDITLGLGNMVAYYHSLPCEYAGYKFDPKLENWVFRNGVMASIPTEFIYPGTLVEVFFVDTRYVGSPLKVDSYEEVGIAFGYRKVTSEDLPEMIVNAVRSFRFGASYIWGNEFSSVQANFGFLF